MNKVTTYLRNKKSGTSERSLKVIANVLASFFIKGMGGVVQILLVPVTLSCLTQYEYGIWMTISTMLVWIDSMDIGLGNGMRNMLATCRAEGDEVKARRVVSTCFVALAAFMLVVGLVLVAAEHFVDFYAFLNVDARQVPDLLLIVQLATVIVCTTFVFKTVGNVYLALQLPAMNNLMLVTGYMLTLVGIFLAKWLFGGVTLLGVSLISTLLPLLVYMVVCPLTFRKYKELRPRLGCFDASLLKGIFALGLKFFVLQVSGVFLFSTSNVIISHYIDPASVAPYQVAQRYFNLILVLFTIIIVPLWSATTDAYARNDYAWIRSCGRKGGMMFALIAVALVGMSLLAPYVYEVWTLGKVQVSASLTWGMALYMMVTMFSLFYAHFLFGMGKISVQMWVTLGEGVVFIPLAIAAAKSYGVEGVLYSLTLVNVACAATNCYQFHSLMRGSAKGIWTK